MPGIGHQEATEGNLRRREAEGGDLSAQRYALARQNDRRLALLEDMASLGVLKAAKVAVLRSRQENAANVQIDGRRLDGGVPVAEAEGCWTGNERWVESEIAGGDRPPGCPDRSAGSYRSLRPDLERSASPQRGFRRICRRLPERLLPEAA